MHSGDADKTIDGEQPRPVVEPKAIPPPAATVYDYGGLITVERHHYLVSREIAKGGMGRVLEARDLRLGRQVAIKELLPRSRDAAKRFEREALITARLQHPAIIHIYEAGIWPGGEPFYAMPHVAGRSLDKVVAERKTVTERLGLLSNVISVADALAYAHSENVIHRDLKPANVLVGEYGETVVIDWGLAKDLELASDPKESLQMRARAAVGETLSGSVVGTPAYMPPEQARGESVDERSDVYAIGALLYKVLVGRAPYEGEGSKEVLDLVKTRGPVSIFEREPGAPRDLVAIVEKAMARDPDDRYATAGALAQDLKRFQTGQLVDAHRYTRSQLVWRFVKQHRVAVLIAVIAVAALAIVGVVSVRSILVEKEGAKVAQNTAEAGRIALLEEQARSELLAGHSGAALAYLVGAAKDGVSGGARGLLIADAMRPFKAELATMPGTAIAVSPDGLHVLSAGVNTVQLSTTDGKLVLSFAVSSPIRVVAFDPRGTRFIAAGDEGVARIWSLAGTELPQLNGHIGSITDASFSPDGSRVVTGGEDSTVRVWNVATGALVATSTCHNQAVTSVRFSPDGTRVASASRDHTACVSGASAGNFITQLRGHKQSVNSVRWTPDGAFLLTASDDGTACAWSAGGSNPAPENADAGGGKLVMEPLRHDRGASIDVIELSPDGSRVLTAGEDHTARVWELPELVAGRGTPAARLVWKLEGHADKVVAAAFSSDGLRIATAGHDNRATVWDASNGQAIGTFENSDIVAGVAFAVGHARLVTGSRDGTVRVWNIADGVAKVRDEQLESAIHGVAVSGDGTVAVATDDSRVTLWHGAVANILQGHLGRVLALAFSRERADRSSFLVTGGDDDQAIVWNVKDGKARLVHKLGVPSTPGTSARKTRAIAFAPTGDTVAILVEQGAGRVVQLWSAATGESRGQLSAEVQIDTIAFSSRGLLAGAGIHGALVLWNPTFHLQVASSPQSRPVTSLAFSEDGRSLVVAGQGALQIYRVITEGGVSLLVPENKIEGPTGDVRAVLFEDHANLVITASDDGVAKVWDARKGKLLATRDPHGSPLTALGLTSTTTADPITGRQRRDDRLWIGSEDGTLGEWDLSVDEHSWAELDRFMRTHVPWSITSDDVIQTVEGGSRGKH